MLRRSLPMLLVAAAAACADGVIPTEIAPPPVSAAQASVEDLARAVAVAMADPAVREDVRDAMRASLLTQHRVPLREYLTSRASASFTAAVARELGSDPAGVRALGERLPDLDFFVPARTDRRSWEATPNFVVVGAVQRPEDGMASAFTPQGRKLQIHLDRQQPGVVVIQLTPTEHRDRRIDPQPAVEGKVIEDENDGVVSGTFTWTPAGGEPVRVQLADLRGNGRGLPDALAMAMEEYCDPETAIIECDSGGGGGGGGGSTAPADTTFLDHFKVFFYDGVGCGDPDPSFIATYYNASGVSAGTGQLDYSEVQRNQDYYPHDALIFRRMVEGSSEKMNVKVVERDSGWCGGDDDKGNRDFSWSDRAQIRTIKRGTTAEANVELDWTPKY